MQPPDASWVLAALASLLSSHQGLHVRLVRVLVVVSFVPVVHGAVLLMQRAVKAAVPALAHIFRSTAKGPG